MALELMIDPDRYANTDEDHNTGIYVRAKHESGKWDSVPIETLKIQSLLDWLRSRDGANRWAEQTVMILLGYTREEMETLNWGD